MPNHNPFKGVSLKQAYHWIWLAIVFITVPIFLICLVAGPGGWFVFLFWVLFIDGTMPLEVEFANDPEGYAKAKQRENKLYGEKGSISP